MNPGIIEFEGPIDISNVMLVCPKCNKACPGWPAAYDEIGRAADLQELPGADRWIGWLGAYRMSHVMKERYQKEVVPALKKSLDLNNVMQVPRVSQSCGEYWCG